MLALWLLQRGLRKRRSVGHEPQVRHRAVPRAGRDKMVERFQAEPAEREFVLSLKVPGPGLKLAAVSPVLHFDL